MTKKKPVKIPRNQISFLNVERRIVEVNLDEVPDLIAKFLAIIDEEATRILNTPPEDRTPQDIQTSIQAVKALTSLHKDVRDEANVIRQEIRLMPGPEVRQLVQDSLFPPPNP